ncbi:MAG: hypothetical protein V4617_13175 [Gemmatimonadota bacterium]
MPPTSRRAAPAVVAPVRVAQAAAQAAARHRTRTALRERALVTSVVAVGIAIAVLGSMRVAGNVRVSRAREAMTGTFARVDERQHEFRRLNARYATLPELARRGIRIPSQHIVQRATATESHWYLSLRDRTTGLICDRTGELSDEQGTARVPVCRAREESAGLDGAVSMAPPGSATTGMN